MTDTETAVTELNNWCELSEKFHQCITLSRWGRRFPNEPAEYIDNLFKIGKVYFNDYNTWIPVMFLVK